MNNKYIKSANICNLQIIKIVALSYKNAFDLFKFYKLVN